MLTHPLPNLLENDSYFLAKDTLILLIPQMQHAVVSLLLNINKSNLIIEVYPQNFRVIDGTKPVLELGNLGR